MMQQDKRNKTPTGPSPAGGMGGGGGGPPKEPPDLSKESFGKDLQKHRNDYLKEQRQKQQSMHKDMSKGQNQSDQGQTQQQSKGKTPDR
jgi:hypothetical protein